MKNELIKRLKSPVVWLAVLSQVLVVVNMFNPDMAEHIKIIITSLIEICTIFGILNNPSDKDNF